MPNESIINRLVAEYNKVESENIEDPGDRDEDYDNVYNEGFMDGLLFALDVLRGERK